MHRRHLGHLGSRALDPLACDTRPTCSPKGPARVPGQQRAPDAVPLSFTPAYPTGTACVLPVPHSGPKWRTLRNAWQTGFNPQRYVRCIAQQALPTYGNACHAGLLVLPSDLSYCIIALELKCSLATRSKHHFLGNHLSLCAVAPHGAGQSVHAPSSARAPPRPVVPNSHPSLTGYQPVMNRVALPCPFVLAPSLQRTGVLRTRHVQGACHSRLHLSSCPVPFSPPPQIPHLSCKNNQEHSHC